jgi:hypothetical protein
LLLDSIYAWQIRVMKKAQIVLGDKAFDAISAVEGLALSKEDRDQINNLRAKGLSNDAIRSEIVRQFRVRKAA